MYPHRLHLTPLVTSPCNSSRAGSHGQRLSERGILSNARTDGQKDSDRGCRLLPSCGFWQPTSWFGRQSKNHNLNSSQFRWANSIVLSCPCNSPRGGVQGRHADGRRYDSTGHACDARMITPLLRCVTLAIPQRGTATASTKARKREALRGFPFSFRH